MLSTPSRGGTGGGGTSALPVAERLGQPGRAVVLRVDQHPPGRERHQRGVDVRRLRPHRLDQVHPVVRPEVPAQPGDPGVVGHVAALADEVPAAADEVGGVEGRLLLGGDPPVAGRVLRGGVVQVVEQPRLGGGGPAGAGREVFPQQRPVRPGLEVAPAVGHRRLDQLVADDQQHVARVGRAEAVLDLPVRGPVPGGEPGRLRPPDPHPGRLQHPDQLGQVLPGGLHPGRRVGPAAAVAQLGRGPDPGRVGDPVDPVPGRQHRLVDVPDDDLLERIPLGEGRHRAPVGDRRCAHSVNNSVS